MYIEKEQFQYLKIVKLKICCGRKSHLGLGVIFCGFISHLIGRETIKIPNIFSGVYGFTGKTVN